VASAPVPEEPGRNRRAFPAPPRPEPEPRPEQGLEQGPEQGPELGPEPEPAGPIQRWWRQRQAPAGIFGTIVGASVLASADPADPLSDVAWAVVVTLVVYWLAERWSELLGSHLRGEPLTRRRIGEVFGRGWPMVQASYTPLVVLLISWALGASNTTALNVALTVCVATLAGLGLVAGRRAGLSGWATAGSVFFTAMLGLTLILMKATLH
jgi:hypothetical protein